MTNNEKRLSAAERKKKIRERYQGVDKDEIKLIPARAIMSLNEDTCVNMLVQEHYAGNWDILRPAKEVEDYSLVTADELKTLMQEAELIMEGWENSYESGTEYE